MSRPNPGGQGVGNGVRGHRRYFAIAQDQAHFCMRNANGLDSVFDRGWEPEGMHQPFSALLGPEEIIEFRIKA